MTARQFFGCVGLLAALFACVTQGCNEPPKLPSRDEVFAVVAKAREVSEKDCSKANAVCAIYFDAVKAGLAPDDERAELACAQAATVCAIVGAGGVASE